MSLTVTLITDWNTARSCVLLKINKLRTQKGRGLNTLFASFSPLCLVLLNLSRNETGRGWYDLNAPQRLLFRCKHGLLVKVVFQESGLGT